MFNRKVAHNNALNIIFYFQQNWVSYSTYYKRIFKLIVRNSAYNVLLGKPLIY